MTTTTIQPTDTNGDTDLNEALRDHRNPDRVRALIVANPIRCHDELLEKAAMVKDQINRINADLTAMRADRLAGRIKESEYVAARAEMQNRLRACERFRATVNRHVQFASAERGRQARAERVGRHEDTMEAERRQLRAAIEAHYKASVAADAIPEPYDLALWAMVGIVVDDEGGSGR